MGIAYRLDPQLGCTVIVWDANVTPDEWRHHFKRMSDDPGFPPGPRVLADLSTAGGAPSFSSEVVGEMAVAWQTRTQRVGPIKLAIVPNGAWEKARELERATEGSGITTIVFNDVATACTWLGTGYDAARSIIDELRGDLAADSDAG